MERTGEGQEGGREKEGRDQQQGDLAPGSYGDRRPCFCVFVCESETLRFSVSTAKQIIDAIWLPCSPSFGNVLVSVNVFALRRARLVPGWVTVCERVKHLGM